MRRPFPVPFHVWWPLAVERARSAPRVLSGWFRRWADWVERLSWWRVLLLILALAIVGSCAKDALRSQAPIKKIERIRYDVHIDSDGSVSVEPRRDNDPAAASASAAPPRSVRVDDGKGEASVAITKEGVVIDAKDAGDHQRIVIDASGVHVTAAPSVDLAPLTPGATPPQPPEPPTGIPGAPAARIVLPPGANEAQIRDALSEVRSDLENLVEETQAVKTRNTAGTLVDGLVAIAIVSAILLKIEGRRRRRAETKAAVATEMAESEQLKRQLSEARLQTMQAQVEPHFLFNTLASIEHLIETDAPRAARMQKSLISYLRGALPKMRETSTTLGREADLVIAYLDILKMRMDERLCVTVDVPAGLRSASFPPMMLQSLVENAIRHGLEPKPAGGTLRVVAEIVDGRLHVSVEDTGMGFGVAGAQTAGTGLGLTNIRDRLALLFGDRARLVIRPNTPSGTVATIEVPYQTGDAPGRSS